MDNIINSYNGIIGKSGKWYPCKIMEHIQCSINNKEDAPFVTIRTHFGDSTARFDAYYTVDKIYPTNQQFETLIDWCVFAKIHFKEITDCHNLPWEPWRKDIYD